jgi:hypothetical protein
MGVMRLFEASIPPNAKIWILLHEEVLGGRGLVYVVARAARRACTETGWDHPDSLRALDLCDQYAEGEEVSKEELERAAEAAARAATWAASAASCASWAASCAAEAARAASRATWAASAAFSATNGEEERRLQLADCREWLLRNSPQERVPVLTRYQRIMRSLH